MQSQTRVLAELATGERGLVGVQEAEGASTKKLLTPPEGRASWGNDFEFGGDRADEGAGQGDEGQTSEQHSLLGDELCTEGERGGRRERVDDADTWFRIETLRSGQLRLALVFVYSRRNASGGPGQLGLNSRRYVTFGVQYIIDCFSRPPIWSGRLVERDETLAHRLGGTG